MSNAESSLEGLAKGLIVSCQPARNGPFDSPAQVVAFAQAAISGGAKGLRVQGAANVRAVKAATDTPVLGLIKRDLPRLGQRITPDAADVDALAAAGAEMIAFDATARERPSPVAALIDRIHAAGRLACADCATRVEAHAAHALGADVVATTLSGYTGSEPPPTDPDLDLVRALAQDGLRVIAEGRIRLPDQAAAAIGAGAFAVVIGTAITRPDAITSWFAQAIG